MAVVSTKHIQLSKASRAIVTAVSVSVFVLVAGIFIGRAIYLRYMHQEAVIAAKSKALEQLQENIEARDNILNAYKVFTDPQLPENIIGGPVGDISESNGGDNARIVLDALPSRYDFPALATSVESMLNSNGLVVENFSGEDDEVNQSAQGASADPQPVEIPFSVTIGQTDYFRAKNAVGLFERSIRPMSIHSMQLSGSDTTLELTVEATTYYQPAQSFEIGTKVIK